VAVALVPAAVAEPVQAVVVVVEEEVARDGEGPGCLQSC